MSTSIDPITALTWWSKSSSSSTRPVRQPTRWWELFFVQLKSVKQAKVQKLTVKARTNAERATACAR